ncbi:response regulator [Vibrio parahaemolyticus]|nr:response regulator [Vibrio parahaemolyticus]
MVCKVQKGAPDLSGMSILLVDENHAIRRSLKCVLNGFGALVTTVSSVHEAILSFENVQFDAVLSELLLKDGKGSELLSQYLKHQPEGTFYMMSEQGNAANASDIIRRGAQSFF